MGTKLNVKVREGEVITLHEANRLFRLNQEAKGIQPCTMRTYDWVYDVFVRDMEVYDDTPVTILNEEGLNEWKVKLINVRELTYETVNSYVARMRTFAYWCMRNGYLDEYHIPLVKMQQRPMKVYSDEDLKKLLKTPDKTNFTEYRTWLITSFMLATGARAGTVRNIKWEDVDFKNKRVQYTHLKNKDYAIVPIPNSLCSILLEYQKLWDTGSEFLFCDISAGQLTVSAMRQALRKYCRKRGVPELGLHALRHSFARGWITNGGGEFQLQQMLTHTTLDMTRKYVKLFAKDLEEDVRNYNPLDTLRKDNGGRTKTVVYR